MGVEVRNEVKNQGGNPAMLQGLFAARPVFGFTGRIYIATDTKEIFRDTGAAWELIGSGANGVPTLQQVATAGNTSNIGLQLLGINDGGGQGANGILITAAAANLGAGVRMYNAVTPANLAWQFFNKGGQVNFVIGRNALGDNLVLGGVSQNVFFPGPNTGADLPAGDYTVYITSGSNAAFIPLIIQGATAQTANLQEWRNSASTVLFSMSAAGNLIKAGGTAVQSLQADGNVRTLDAATYTPTSSALINITTLTVQFANYTQVASVVNVNISLRVTPTAAGAVSANLSLPVVAALLNIGDCIGLSTVQNGSGTGLINVFIVRSGNQTVGFSYDAVSTNAASLYMSFSYTV